MIAREGEDERDVRAAVSESYLGALSRRPVGNAASTSPEPYHFGSCTPPPPHLSPSPGSCIARQRRHLGIRFLNCIRIHTSFSLLSLVISSFHTEAVARSELDALRTAI